MIKYDVYSWIISYLFLIQFFSTYHSLSFFFYLSTYHSLSLFFSTFFSLSSLIKKDCFWKKIFVFHRKECLLLYFWHNNFFLSLLLHFTLRISWSAQCLSVTQNSSRKLSFSFARSWSNKKVIEGSFHYL